MTGKRISDCGRWRWHPGPVGRTTAMGQSGLARKRNGRFKRCVANAVIEIRGLQVGGLHAARPTACGGHDIVGVTSAPDFCTGKTQ